MNDRLVLCLGNEILSDDGLGFVVARQLQQSQAPIDADVCSAALAGFALLDLLAGRREVLIVDAIITGKSHPGTIYSFPASHLAPTWNLVGSHHISLPTAIEFGRLYRMTMPESVDVIAVEVSDVQTLHEGLTPLVAKAVPEVVARVRHWAGRGTARPYELNKFAAEVRP